MLNYGVITICLNSEATIARTIDSVLAQDPPPKKYVFVDGGSSDDTKDIIEETMQAHNTISNWELLHQEDTTGIAAAWNMGLDCLSTDIIMILNSDDWYEPGAVASVLERFEQCPDAGIVVAHLALTGGGKDGVILKPRSHLLLPVTNPIPHPSTFVRRSVYEQVGRFDERYQISADYDFLYRCSKAGIGIATLETALVNMQWGGATNENRGLASRESLDIGKRHTFLGVLPRLAYALRVAGMGR